jgi:hypothetical protein
MADQRKPSNADIVRMRDSLRVFLEELSGLLRSKLHPAAAGSQAAVELAASPDRTEEIGMAYDQGVILLESASENLSLFAKGLDEPAEPMGCLVNIRGVLEACAVSVWLLDPAINSTERMSRGMGRRIEGLEEMRKFAQAAKAEDMIAHALARLEHARQKTADTGIKPTKVPGSTEIIKRMLDFEVEYRLLSGVAHGQGWALMQAAYAISETLPGLHDASPTGKQIKPAFICFAGVQGFRAITKAAWCAVAMFGLDRKRFSEIVDGFYLRFGGEPKGDLYWRLP